MNTYIVKAYRSPVGKAKKGRLRNIRPDDLGATVLNQLVKDTNLTKEIIEDVIVGNAMPEAEQGLNLGRMISLMGLDTVKIPGMTVNRYCASGLEAIAIGAAKINAGLAQCLVAGGVESMSMIPMGGWRITPHPTVGKDHPDWYWNMGLTAEALRDLYDISREEQDEFSFQSHQKAINAIENGYFESQYVKIPVIENHFKEGKETETREFIHDVDEGPRSDTSPEKLGELKPVFSAKGMVTAGNSSQTSDGAAFLMLASEEAVKHYNLTPVARFVGYSVAGVEPKHMGIGPVEAVPKVLKQTGMQLKDIDLIELNEAFAIQSLAVINELKLDKEKVNVNGGAIALGHPLGCTGAKLSVQIIHELKRRKGKYGMVTMCVGTGQGAAGIFEVF